MNPKLLLSLALLTASVSAQGRGNGGGADHGSRSGPFGMSPTPREPSSTSSQPNAGPTIRTPSRTSAGRWWDNSDFARSVGIDGKQQRRLDSVFEANKPALVQLYQNLQSQQSQLDSLRSHSADETQLFQQIDRVTQARGDLQKAYAHLLLQIRKELTPAQAAKLDEYHPS